MMPMLSVRLRIRRNPIRIATFQTALADAFRWKDGVMADLGSLPPNHFSAGGSINARGWIAGQGTSSTVDPNLGVNEGRALLWTNRRLIDLGDLPGGHQSLSVYVDDNGEVVGFSDNGVPDVNSDFFFPTGTQIRTFLWQNGKMRDIGTLGGASAVPGIICEAQPRNFVVGASFVDDNVNASTGVPTVDPFLWKDGKMTIWVPWGAPPDPGHARTAERKLSVNPI